MATRRKRMSKHDNPGSPLLFRNWIQELHDVIGKMPRGQECVDIDCVKLAANRNAFLCTSCGVKYYDAYKTILSPSERARAQLNWLKKHVLAEEPE